MSLGVEEMSRIDSANRGGEVSLRLLDANGTGLENATVFVFSSEEVTFGSAMAQTDEGGRAHFNFTVLVEPYAGMAVVSSAMKPGYENTDVLVYFAGELFETVEPAPKDGAEPSDPLGNYVTLAALAAGGVSLALYLYWGRRP